MDGSLSEGLDSTPEERKELEAETQASKRRQVVFCFLKDFCASQIERDFLSLGNM